MYIMFEIISPLEKVEIFHLSKLESPSKILCVKFGLIGCDSFEGNVVSQHIFNIWLLLTLGEEECFYLEENLITFKPRCNRSSAVGLKFDSHAGDRGSIIGCYKTSFVINRGSDNTTPKCSATGGSVKGLQRLPYKMMSFVTVGMAH